MEMIPRCLDDLVSPQHPVRQIAGVVEHLDVSGFCQPIKAREGVAGRDATDPQLLVALWLYACVRGIGSARELARQCQENLPFLWLLGGVTVNHRLLSDFRSQGGSALDQLFTQVIASLVEQGVVKVSRLSQDGVRVRVGAGASSFRREERLEKLLEDALIKVSAVASKLDTLSVRDMLEALIGGERDPQVLADLARGKMKAKRGALIEALTGRFDDHHAELARMLLDQIDTLTAQVGKLTTRIEELTGAIPAAQGVDPELDISDIDALRRVAEYHRESTAPRLTFVLASATISEPEKSAELLTGQRAEPVTSDAAPRAAMHAGGCRPGGTFATQ